MVLIAKLRLMKQGERDDFVLRTRLYLQDEEKQKIAHKYINNEASMLNENKKVNKVVWKIYF